MLLLLAIDGLITLFSWLFGLLPFPSLTDLFPSFLPAFEYFFGLIPDAAGLLFWFVGSEVWAVFHTLVMFYFVVADILLAVVTVGWLRKLFVFIKSLPFVG